MSLDELQRAQAVAVADLGRVERAAAILERVHDEHLCAASLSETLLDETITELQHGADALELAVRQHESQARNRLDEQLMATLMQFGELVEKQRALSQRYLARRLQSIDAQIAMCKQTFYLSLFALHLTWETNGVVQMRRLDANHGEFRRCCAAVADNIKPKFFEDHDIVRGVRVREVFKMRHQVLLDEFRRQASHSDCRIKGLFCSVAAESVERLVVYGFEPPTDSARDSIFDPWVQQRQQNGSQIARFIQQSAPLRLPVFLSRFSTLEAEKSHLSDDGDESKRYLVLCRVIVPKQQVLTAVPREKYQSGHGLVSSMEFDGELQEFVCSYPSHIFPEYLMQYQYDRAEIAGSVDNEDATAPLDKSPTRHAEELYSKRLAAYTSDRMELMQEASTAIQTCTSLFTSNTSTGPKDQAPSTISELREAVQRATEQLAQERATTAKMASSRSASAETQKRSSRHE